MAISKPLSARCFAIPYPMPRLPPVTNATFFISITAYRVLFERSNQIIPLRLRGLELFTAEARSRKVGAEIKRIFGQIFSPGTYWTAPTFESTHSVVWSTDHRLPITDHQFSCKSNYLYHL